MVISAVDTKLHEQLSRIYTPSTPISDPRLFSGRSDAIERVKKDLAIEGRVFIVFGERGVGKTSFCNVVLHGVKSLRYQCKQADTFASIFLNVLIDHGSFLTETERKGLSERTYEVSADALMKPKAGLKMSNEHTFEPLSQEVLDEAAVLRRLKKDTALKAIVFDEFQSIADKSITNRMKGLVKLLSDENIGITLFFVGVGASDKELIPEDGEFREYKMRHYVPIRVPRMTQPEVVDILTKREKLFGIHFKESSTIAIARIANGLPDVAHAIALYSCGSWLNDNIAQIASNAFSRIPWVGKLFKLTVKEINMHIDEKHVIDGVQTYLSEFTRAYTNEMAIMSDPKIVPLTRVMLQTYQDEGTEIADEDVVRCLQCSDADVEMLGQKLSFVMVRSEGRWRIKSGRFGTALLGLNYLMEKSVDLSPSSDRSLFIVDELGTLKEEELRRFATLLSRLKKGNV